MAQAEEQDAATAAALGLRMPAETAPHERTLMAWPCRRELWGSELVQAKREHAGVANAVCAFESLTMVCGSEADAEEARRMLDGRAEVVVLPIDDSWLRDSGPIFVTDGGGRRAGVHFGFNAWGEKFLPFDQDAAVGARLVELVGDELLRAPFVLEGGSIAVDGRGTLVTTEECLLNPNRNPDLDRADLEALLREHLGVTRVVWLAEGLIEDRDTDGHVDLIAAFTDSGQLLLQAVGEEDPNYDRMEEDRRRAVGAGIDVLPFPVLARIEVAGEPVVASYLNLYVCNGGVVVPLAGVPDLDAEALDRLRAAYPEREVVGVPAATIAYGGGGPHCITQQVPRVG